MKKGTVLSIDKRSALVFTDDCQLLRLPLMPDMAVGREIALESPVSEMPRLDWSRMTRPALATAAMFLIIALSVWSLRMFQRDPVYAYISVDVKPSVQLQLDRDLQVTAAEGLDEASRQLLAGLPLAGKDWQVAINVWLTQLAQETDLGQETILISAVFPEKNNLLREQLESVNGHGGSGILAGLDVHIAYSSDYDLVQTAQANHLTIGRQMLLIKSERLSQDWDPNTIVTAPLSILVHTLLAKDATDVTAIDEPITESVLNVSDPSTSESVVATSEQPPATARSTVQDTMEMTTRQTQLQTESSASSTTVSQSNESSSSISQQSTSTQQLTDPSYSSEPAPSTSRETSQESTSSASSEPSKETTTATTTGTGPGSPSPSTSGTMGRKMSRFTHQRI